MSEDCQWPVSLSAEPMRDSFMRGGLGLGWHGSHTGGNQSYVIGMLRYRPDAPQDNSLFQCCTLASGTEEQELYLLKAKRNKRHLDAED